MNLLENKTYQIIGKVESINTGAHFSNTTIVTVEQEHINIKLNDEQVPLIKLGQVYAFTAVAVVRYEDDLVLRLDRIDPVEKVLNERELEKVLKHFYVYAPMPVSEIKAGIESYLKKIKNPVLAGITYTIYKENQKMFYMHPAATKFHHAYVGGLSFHTLTMLKLIDPFIDVYPYLDRDLLYAGTILHDMSKLTEISGVDGEYTKEGLLVGHLVMQALDIEVVAKKLGFQDREETLLLKHMILAHHGQYHFGSPKKPQTGEALLLWYIDTIDSKFSVLGDVLAETKAGQFTGPVQVLDKMKFYKSKK